MRDGLSRPSTVIGFFARSRIQSLNGLRRYKAALEAHDQCIAAAEGYFFCADTFETLARYEAALEAYDQCIAACQKLSEKSGKDFSESMRSAWRARAVLAVKLGRS